MMCNTSKNIVFNRSTFFEKCIENKLLIENTVIWGQKNRIQFVNNELKLCESRLFFIWGALPPTPPFFCRLVNVRLVFIIFILGARPSAPPFYVFILFFNNV